MPEEELMSGFSLEALLQHFRSTDHLLVLESLPLLRGTCSFADHSSHVIWKKKQ